MPRPSPFTPEQHEEMARLYKDGKTTPEIGTVFGRHRGTIYDALRCRGVVMRDRSEAKRKYTVADRAFFTIHDEETAYWLEPVNDFGREAVCSGYEQETIPE